MKPENTNQQQSDQQILQHLENASRIVQTWPSWKQGLLANSSLTTNSTPRTTEAKDATSSNAQRD